MKQYLNKRYSLTDEKLKEELFIYYDNMYHLPISGEKYFYSLFRFPDLTAKLSITEIFSK